MIQSCQMKTEGGAVRKTALSARTEQSHSYRGLKEQLGALHSAETTSSAKAKRGNVTQMCKLSENTAFPTLLVGKIPFWKRIL